MGIVEYESHGPPQNMPVFGPDGGEIMAMENADGFVQLSTEDPDDPQVLHTEYMYRKDFEDLCCHQPQYPIPSITSPL